MFKFMADDGENLRILLTVKAVHGYPKKYKLAFFFLLM